MNMNKIGCCGFPVSHDRYYESFTVIEVQSTFYQPPRPETAGRWRGEAPESFEFTLKAWQLITHEASSPTYRRLKEELSESEKGRIGAFRWTAATRRAWDRTLGIARHLAADKVLFQCPASFRPTNRNKDRLRRFFGRIDREGIRCLWEPRGRWTEGEIGALCRELNLTHSVDPFRRKPATTGLRYFRLHGITGYRHRYSDEELLKLSELSRKRAPVYFLFNNQGMFEDATRFEDLVARQVHDRG